jgi:hypothetical protein
LAALDLIQATQRHQKVQKERQEEEKKTEAPCLKYATCVLALPGVPSAVSHCIPSSTEAPRPISAPSPSAPSSPSLVRFLRQVCPNFSPSDQEPQCQGAKPRAALLLPSLSVGSTWRVPVLCVVFPGSFFAPVTWYLCCLPAVRQFYLRRTATDVPADAHTFAYTICPLPLNPLTFAPVQPVLLNTVSGHKDYVHASCTLHIHIYSR